MKHFTLGQRTACFYSAAAICAAAASLFGAAAASALSHRILFFALFVTTVCSAFLMYFLVLRPARNIKEAYTVFCDTKNLEPLLECDLIYAESYMFLNEIKDILDRRAEVASFSKHAEFLALQNQINPHFLYNTLEAIRSDALYAGLDSLAETVKALATFFRYTISENGDAFSVQDELDNVRNYFTIQNYRFGDKLRFQVHFDTDTDRKQILACRLPKLTLQPIVENAIRHGLEPKKHGGIVTISFEMTQTKLIISIADDGVGMDGDFIRQLNRSLTAFEIHSGGQGQPSAARQSIALRNVNSRIKLLFGLEYGLHIFSHKDVGTDVRITLPLTASTVPRPGEVL